jgi:putative membrane protein
MKKTIITILFATGMSLLQAQSVSDQDKKFAKSAAEDGMKEVKLGKLAQTNSSSAECKKLGQMMVDDHTKAGDELKAWASKKNVELPTALSNDGQKDYDKMAKMKGEEFDKEYSKCMVKDHKKAVSEFKKEADKGDDADLKAWAAKTLPTLEHHLKMSEDACDMMKKDKDKDNKVGAK